MTTSKGDRLVLTSLTQDGPLGKDTTLTLYKEIKLAEGLNSYQKLEEKIVQRKRKAIRTIEKKIFDKKGKEIASVNTFEDSFFSNSTNMFASVKRALYMGKINHQVSMDTKNDEYVNVNDLRPEVKRLFKLLGEGKLNNLFFK